MGVAFLVSIYGWLRLLPRLLFMLSPFLRHALSSVGDCYGTLGGTFR
jgi:hypothetical protein